MKQYNEQCNEKYDDFNFVNNIKLQDIKNLHINSNNIQEGDCFFAIKGVKYDGNDFINEAIEKGAKLVISDNPKYQNLPNVLIVNDVRKAAAVLSEKFYPKQPKFLAAVTGTNGKTSIVEYFRQIFELLGKKSASIGTIGIKTTQSTDFLENLGLFDNLTSSNIIDNRKILNALAQHQIETAAFEASSHGLEQGRFEGIKFNAVCFCSFGLDHLDYHKSVEKYLEAKLILLKNNISTKTSAIDAINETKIIIPAKTISQINQCGINTMECEALKNITTYEIIYHKQTLTYQHVRFKFKNQEFEFTTPIIGGFQIDNIILASLLALGHNLKYKKIIDVLPLLKAPRGRLEKVPNINKHIFIDYAHNPHALENVLNELKKLLMPNSKLLVVFGCGGQRDETKRPVMGKIACEYADHVIITDDNPRNEDPQKIRNDIINGIKNSKFKNKKFMELAVREKAIYYAIKMMQKDDVLLIAGKGHEQYQIINDHKIHYCDLESVKSFSIFKK